MHWINELPWYLVSSWVGPGDWRTAREGVWSVSFSSRLPPGPPIVGLPPATKSHSFLRNSSSQVLVTHYSFPCPCSPESGNSSLKFLNLNLAPFIVGFKLARMFVETTSRSPRLGTICFLFGGKSVFFPSHCLQTFHWPLPNRYNPTFKTFSLIFPTCYVPELNLLFAYLLILKAENRSTAFILLWLCKHDSLRSL